MAKLAGFLAGKHQVKLLGRTVSVVTLAADLEDVRRVLMRLGKRRLLMTIKTTALESKPAPPAQGVTLRAFDLNRRGRV
jgi:hypothetical protein